MKKLFFILFFTINSINLMASEDMTMRWEQRHTYLLEIEQRAKKFSGGNLTALIKNEIEDTEKIMTKIRREQSGESSFQGENRRFNIRDIESKVNEIATPIVKVYYIRGMTRLFLSTTQRDKISHGIKLEAEKEKLQGMSNRVLMNMTKEYILSLTEKIHGSFQKQAIHEILSAVELHLSKVKYTMTPAVLKRIIIEESIKKMEEPEAFDFVHPQREILRATPAWLSLINVKDQRKEIITSIKLFASKRSLKLPENINDMPMDEIESILFKERFKNLESLLKETRKPQILGSYNALEYQIPDLTCLRTLVSSIDSYRKNILKNLKGSEGRLFSLKVRRNIDKITAKYMKSIEKRFSSEEKRIHDVYKSKQSIMTKEEIFKIAREQFRVLKKEIMEYAQDSGDFIGSLCIIGKKEPGEFVFKYSRKIMNKSEHLAMLAMLTQGAGKTATLGNEKVHRVYVDAIRNSIMVSRKLKTPLGIPLEVRRGMTVESLRKIKSMNANFKRNFNEELKTIRQNHNSYINIYDQTRKDMKKKYARGEIIFATDELEQLMEFATKCAREYEKLNSGDDSFQKYRDKFDSIVQSIQSGKNNGTLSRELPLLRKTLRREIINNEHGQKLILRELAMKYLNGSVELKRYYSRRGIKLHGDISSRDMGYIKNTVSKKASVKILAWTMDEKNYSKTEQKAEEWLRQLINKKAWSDEETQTPIAISVAGIDLSVQLPMGWRRLNSNSKELTESFISPDGKGKIEIFSFEHRNENLRQAQEVWNRQQGYSLIKKEWGSVAGKNYFRAVSRDSRNKVIQSYAISRGKTIVLLAGISQRGYGKRIGFHLNKILMSIKETGKAVSGEQKQLKAVPAG